MKEFEFEYEGIRCKFGEDEYGRIRTYHWENRLQTPTWENFGIIASIASAGIRALLSAHTEREKIFAEAMDLARALADVLGSDISKDKLNEIAARWQATTGDATGAGTVKETT